MGYYSTRKHLTVLVALVLISAVVIAYGAIQTSAQDSEGDSVRGGLLYDKWWAVTGAEKPADDHPLWATQEANTRSGADTWRCKECHGWDYNGADGAYATGSHFTGFPGILDAGMMTAEDVRSWLDGTASADHDFSGVMDDQALLDLTVFITDTLIDTDPLINEDNTSTGDATRGEALYGICAGCHGPDGNAITFGSLDDPDVLSGVANGNPWEFVHKTRYGQPGWPMPSTNALGLAESDVADILAYAQTLPGEPALSGGGLLYDKWWAVVGADAPTDDQPLWATQETNTRSGSDTWRCKECHGWDYRGADGAYATGSHFTGFPGILDAEDVRGWLDGTANADHDFSGVMDEYALDALVVFVQAEAADISMYVNDDKTVNGDADVGQSLFASSCASCHGAEGQAINFGSDDEPVYIGTLALDNPSEFYHKTSFGQPGQPMPGSAALGWTQEDIANLVAFAQTLPSE